MTDRANDIDVTTKVRIDWIDFELVGVGRCVCGQQGEFCLDTDRNEASACDTCGRKLYVRQVTQIFEVRE